MLSVSFRDFDSETGTVENASVFEAYTLLNGRCADAIVRFRFAEPGEKNRPHISTVFRSNRTRQSAMSSNYRLAENVRPDGDAKPNVFARICTLGNVFAGRETRVVFYVNNNSSRKTSPCTDARPWATCERCANGATPKEDRTVASIRTRRIVSDGLREFYPFPLAVFACLLLSFCAAPTFGALTPNDGFPKNTNTRAHTHANVSNRRENNNKVTKVRARTSPRPPPRLSMFREPFDRVSLSTGFVS